MTDTTTKLNKLMAMLKEMESVATGFSGGADSAFLVAAAQRTLGDKAVAVTAYSATLPESEKQAAIEFARQMGVHHILLEISELESPDFVANRPDRCYYCKQQRFSVLSRWAAEHGFQWVLEGSNADDTGDYRPGMRAVGELAAVRSPLLEVGLTKAEIRQLSADWNLPTWNKLSAACLSSRVAYGQPITEEKLKQIEQGEELLKRYCSGQVRLRHHGTLARIEVFPEDMPALAQPPLSQMITRALKDLGFTYVTLDLAGYRMGSMNETIEKPGE
ncbi:MAG: ATP-dependent sacrificial sulfur transferase LarE [Negativicutes bacterium]|nr:ATP-dependent sacrificial sulfur transferase LarE [Negativicutes bacterium]